MNKIVTIKFPTLNEEEARDIAAKLDEIVAGLLNPYWIHTNINDPSPEEQEMISVFESIESEEE
jgi:hypothetical protein